MPYANGPISAHPEASPALAIGFCNSGTVATRATMDTGSTGLLVSRDLYDLSKCAAATRIKTGKILYSSSGIIENGTWYQVEVDLFDGDRIVGKASIPVLQVTSRTCASNPRHCTPSPDPKGVAMLGIGFGRLSSQQPDGTADHNAFLNLTGVATAGRLQPVPAGWVNGYVVADKGVALGLSAADTQDATLVKLEPGATPPGARLKEWRGAPARFTVQGPGHPASQGNGKVLMDTGVDTGYLSPPCVVGSPDDCLDHGPAPSQTTISLDLNPGATPFLYGVTVTAGGAAPQPPHPAGSYPPPLHGVDLVNDGVAFYNTSRVFFQNFNVVFDEVDGWAGYLQVVPPPK